MRELGVEREVKSAAECVALEPALAHSSVPIAGGDYSAHDESGDARKFTQALARRAMGFGVTFLYGRTIRALEREGDRIVGVVLDTAEERGLVHAADAYVLALGSYSPLLAARVGVRLPVYPVKGYSLTLALGADDVAPSLSLTDEAHKIVFSRLGQRLRVPAPRAEWLRHRAQHGALRGTARTHRGAVSACGRPCERAVLDRAASGHAVQRADHRPLAAAQSVSRHRARHARWTLACGSGRAIADIVSGSRPRWTFRSSGCPTRCAPRASPRARQPREKEPAE